MPIYENEFKRIIGNMLKMPPKKHADTKYPRQRRSKLGDELQASIDKAAAEYKAKTDCSDMSEVQIRFEAILDKVFSVSKKELDRRLAEEKKQKDAKGLKRYSK